MLSYDIFNYIATSKALFFYHENPYIIMPIELIGDPLLLFMHAANKVALYGPSWILLSGIPFLFGSGNFIITLFGFKLFIAVFYFATAFLIWKMSKNIFSVILFALNPLVIIETLIGGHNDIVMIFFALLSFFFLTKRKVFFAILFFILSLLIKYATILLLPVFLHALWRIFKRKEIDWKNIFYFSALIMILGFLLSPIREEIYPWYAIWFLPFVFLVPEKKTLVYVSIFSSFGLLFRYVPYMFSGIHEGLTPILKSLVTFAPAFLILLYLICRKLWEKISTQ
jgi:Gpi18-like mannosyltransferase